MASLLLPRVARRAATAVGRSIHSARSPHESGPVASTSAAPAGDRLPRAGRRSVRTASTIAPSERKNGSNPAMSFPCVDANESRTARLQAQIMLDPLPNYPATTDAEDPDGPEPAYSNVVTGYSLYRHPFPFTLDYGGHLPSFDLAYETWGTMNAAKDNVILVHTGLSASSHAKSTPANPSEGWWEKFIGSGKSIDTDKYFVICTNVLGGCYGSTGPSSLDPSDGKPYATRFPVLSIFDMVRAQLHLLDSLGVDKLYASVGSSMGGMQSIALASIGGERVARVVSISGTARSSPSSIAMRHAQRSGEHDRSTLEAVLTDLSTHGGPGLESGDVLRWHAASHRHEARSSYVVSACRRHPDPDQKSLPSRIARVPSGSSASEGSVEIWPPNPPTRTWFRSRRRPSSVPTF